MYPAAENTHKNTEFIVTTDRHSDHSFYLFATMAYPIDINNPDE